VQRLGILRDAVRRSRYMSSPSATQIHGNPRAASWYPGGRCTTVAIEHVSLSRHRL
jgi:hypothetical protein